MLTKPPWGGLGVGGGALRPERRLCEATGRRCGGEDTGPELGVCKTELKSFLLGAGVVA